MSFFYRLFSLFSTMTLSVVMPLLVPSIVQADEAANIEFFEKKIRPVLVQHCYKCHSGEAVKANKLKGGLLLDTREGLRKGGDSGPAVVPGEVGRSLLIQALRQQNFEMPPSGKLADHVIADFVEWVKMGAQDPRDGQSATIAPSIDWSEARRRWGFQAPRPVEVPSVRNTSWPRSDIDRFVLSELEARDLHPADDTSREVLIRRLYNDLIGLPPTFEEIQEFVEDNSPNALERRVDELLASPHFGIRWARHWLDNVRFTVIVRSDGEGRIAVPSEPYRDWVVRAFNEDMPYRDFVKYQVAGDLLPPSEVDLRFGDPRTGTAVWALAPYAQNVDALAAVADHVDEQLNTLGRTFLGLTVSCARCHDHKFDPIQQSDYYALAGIFFSSHAYSKPIAGRHLTAPLLYSQADEERWNELDQTFERLRSQIDAGKKKFENALRLQKLNQEVAKLENKITQAEEKERKRLQSDLSKKRESVKPLLEHQKQHGWSLDDPDFLAFAKLEQELERIRQKWDKFPRQLVTREGGIIDRWTGKTADSPMFIRGNPQNPGAEITRGFPQVFSGRDAKLAEESDLSGSGRLELAYWLAQEDHPLTARVMVNRIWQHLFGRGIVGTPSNFGQMGDKPTHPELLDHLTIQFVRNNWSTKQLIRSLVLSRIYRVSTTPADQEASRLRDADNRYLSRAHRRRLDAESLADQLVALSGSLNRELKVDSNATLAEVDQVMRQSGRALYRPPSRRDGDPVLDLFDGANPNVLVPRRDDTTSTRQTLFMLNSGQTRRTAEHVARETAGVDTDERLRRAYRIILKRQPRERDVELSKKIMAALTAEWAGTESGDEVDERVWTDFCHVLICSNEFLYID